ncbi:hypothetical protein [Streptomyces sp. NPDC127098]|uniref:hypothetical protein n=1 Tax=Streptomyces sp. NPDC127098 TaxID=3347137 RepID=UPI0036461834
MSDEALADAYQAWHQALGVLTGGATELIAWQERRYRFAHRLGDLLTMSHADSTSVDGPVVYGVQLPGAGLSYVGQTRESERRLRDLAVGESHHLGNTVPPEIWERVIVVQWPRLVDGLPEAERVVAEQGQGEECGLALEYLLQVELRPILNGRQRTPAGEWRVRNLAASRSRGALTAKALPTLFGLVWETWRRLSSVPAPEHGDPLVTVPEGRVAFPSLLS